MIKNIQISRQKRQIPQEIEKKMLEIYGVVMPKIYTKMFLDCLYDYYYESFINNKPIFLDCIILTPQIVLGKPKTKDYPTLKQRITYKRLRVGKYKIYINKDALRDKKDAGTQYVKYKIIKKEITD